MTPHRPETLEFLPGPSNVGFVEGLYERYLNDSASVPEDWRKFFAKVAEGELRVPRPGFRPSFQPVSVFNPPEGRRDACPTLMQDRVCLLIRLYRVRGHRIAQVDPLGQPQAMPPELEPAFFGFTEADMELPVETETFEHGNGHLTLGQLLEKLRNTYCRSIGVQYMHIDELEVRRWLQRRMEGTENRLQLSRAEQMRILTRLTDAVAFEEFSRRKFVGVTTFSLEGSESLIPLLDLAIEKAASQGIQEIVLGMAHRGRLNVLANILGKSPRQIFREYADTDWKSRDGQGDVKYHLGHSTDWMSASGAKIHLSLCFNPSHLEFVDPIVLGRTRAKQDRVGDWQRRRGMALLIHGDGSFPGQGIVQETLNLSQLPGYTVGGTLHIVVNNQIGFTTSPNQARSSPYATDVARMLQIPIFHVNGEDPEAVAQVVQLALDFRFEFNRDVVIDMYGYRRLGHNEGDEPEFTQPVLYRAVEQRKSVREGYLDHLLKLEGLSREEADVLAAHRRDALEKELAAAESNQATPAVEAPRGIWAGYYGGPEQSRAGGSAAQPGVSVPPAKARIGLKPGVQTSPKPTTRTVPPDTGVPAARSLTVAALNAQTDPLDGAVAADKLASWLEALTRFPSDFHPHPKIQRLAGMVQRMARGEAPLNWTAAESLALASLACEGVRVRLSGQDSERGTFSQRHAVLHDYEDGHTWTPLQHLAADQAPVEVLNSPLSENGVLGFEYGYSLDCPRGLILWEAQYGDFFNVAQPIMDQFIAGAEEKWQRLSGLVLLLPHGYEGQGPEHSSARIERFLELAAGDNIQVVYPTTPAQYFHVLRRQGLNHWRKPLVVFTPKSLLRHKKVVSSLEDCALGEFQRVIPDKTNGSSGANIQRVILCAGKIYYELEAHREETRRQDVAIVRLEQLYPLRPERIESALTGYAAGAPVFWVQEEPENMGAWNFLRGQFGARLFNRFPFAGVARPTSASPATGSYRRHQQEQAELIERAFGGNGGPPDHKATDHGPLTTDY